MYPVSQDVINLFKANQYQQAKVEVFTPAATLFSQPGASAVQPVVTIGPDRILQNGLVVDRYCVTGEKLEIGTAVAAELTLKLNNKDGYFNNVAFKGKWLRAQVGIKDWSDEAASITWIPLGWFVVDSAPRKLSTITVKALDFMTLLDAPMSVPDACNFAYAATYYGLQSATQTKETLCPSVKVGDGTSETKIPTSLSIDTSRTALANSYHVNLAGLPILQQQLWGVYRELITWYSGLKSDEMTYRNCAVWVAQLLGANAYIDYHGRLCIGWLQDTGLSITSSDRYSSDMAEDDVTLTGVSCTAYGSHTYTEGEDSGDTSPTTSEVDTEAQYIVGNATGIVVDITGNKLFGENSVPTVLSDIYDLVGGTTYRPFEATVKPCPYLWPMDKITYVDAGGASHSTIITNVTFTINAPTSIAAKGESNTSAGSPSAGTMGSYESLNVQKAVVKGLSADTVEAKEATVDKLNGFTFDNRWGSIPKIGTDGVMDVGKYLDFHSSDNADDTDYNARVACEGHELIVEADNFKISVSKGSFRPYYQAGDKLTGKWKGGGYVTTAKKEVVFTVPLAKPIVGSPTITVAASLIIRQGSKYTHGSSSSTKVKPSSYEIERGIGDAVCITCVMSDLTNAVNNDACAVAADLTITFS